MIYKSKVKGYEGWCICVWKNTSVIDNMQDGCIGGFFRLLKYPFKEFHGGFFKNKRTGKITILSTEGL